MKLIKPHFEILEQQPGIDGIYKMIELAGRTCYKSEDKITEDSAKGFVERMIKSGHLAMLEHGTVYLYCTYTNTSFMNLATRYTCNKYSQCNVLDIGDGIYITTNLRVLVENDWLDDLQYICEPTEYHEKRVTVRFICDRGILAEFTRHRTFSFAAESTRYCNYSKDKFNNELTFILPYWMNNYDLENHKRRIERGDFRYNEDSTEGSFSFIFGLEEIEDIYISLINEENWKPQQARAILPNALKTELVMTGFVSNWKHFFELRCAPSAHPQAQELAIPLKEEFIKRDYINETLDSKR